MWDTIKEFTGAAYDATKRFGKWYVPPSPATYIIDAAIGIVLLVNGLAGLKIPDKGEAFARAAREWQKFEKSLDSARAWDVYWSGEAAEAYNDALVELQKLARDMQAADASTADGRPMQHAVESQGERCQHAHWTCDSAVAELLIARGASKAVYPIPYAGPGMSLAIQIAAATAAAVAVSTLVGLTIDASVDNGRVADARSDDYRNVDETATAFAENIDLYVPPPQILPVSGSPVGVGRIAAEPAEASVPPGLVGLPGGRDLARDLDPLRGRSDDDDDDEDDGDEDDDETRPWFPELELPTRDEVSDSVRQTLTLSAYFLASASLLAQLGGTVHQGVMNIVSTAQQNQEPVPPAPPAPPVPAVEPIPGADEQGASGPEFADRAPIDVAVSGSELEGQPGSVEQPA